MDLLERQTLTKVLKSVGERFGDRANFNILQLHTYETTF